MAQNPSSVMHRTNPRAATNPKKEAQPTRMCRDDSNKGNQPHHTHTHTTKNKRGRNRRSNSAASTPFIVAVLLLFVVDPPLSFPANNDCIHTTTLIHTTTTVTVIQSLTSLSEGPTKTSPSTLQANRRETCTQAAATTQHRSDLLRIPRRHKHCDKHSTVKYEFNEQADQRGGCLET